VAITQERLKELFDYREDGNLVRNVAVEGPSGQVGRVVGFKLKDPARPEKIYMATKINGQHYCIHKLIWLWHYGILPEQLDHINRNSLDNRVENLRLATASENMMNRKTFKNNTSGCRGVSWHKRLQKWGVSVSVAGKQKHLGYFEDFELAELVSIQARDLYHGRFASI